MVDLALPCWTKEDADAVLQTQALGSQEAIFLATHTPVRDFEVSAEKFDISEPTQEGLLQTLSAEGRTHAFCVVQGEPGSGKSQLIRWLEANWPVEHDFRLLIQRADGSLLGALKQLKTKLPAELGHLFDGLGQQHAAGLTGRASLFLNTLGTMLAPAYFDVPPDDIDWCRKFEPGNLILSAAVREHWGGPRRVLEIMNGGKDRNSASATFDIDDVRELGAIWAKHEAGDGDKAKLLGLKLSLENSFIDEALGAGRTLEEIRTQCADEIPQTLQMVRALNARRNQAVQGVLGVSAEALKRLFMELRAELARADKDRPPHERRRLVLLLEDVTMWEGLDDSLIDALVADAGLRDDDVCPLISVIGLTTEYFRQLKSNYQQRITHSIRLGLGVDGKPGEIAALGDGARAQFVARYLSAVRAGVASLTDWRSRYRHDPTLPPPNPCKTCPRSETCLEVFGSVDEISLFPFTSASIDRFYDALKDDDQGQTHRTPRGMLQGVLNPTLLNPTRLQKAAYPGPEIESSYLSRPFLDTSMRAHLRNSAGDEATEGRLSRIVSYWGDQRPRVTHVDGHERFADVPRSVYEAFGLPWIGEGQTATAPQPASAITPRMSSEAVAPVPEIKAPPQPREAPSDPAVRQATSSKPAAAKSVSKKELQSLLEQIEALRGDGIVPKATDWNKAVFDIVSGLDPRRLGADKRVFDQVFTAENIKIAGTGQVRDTHLVVPRSEWLVDGLEAYARLKTDDDLTFEQIEFHRGRLASLSRRLERLARAHLDRLLPRVADGSRWSPARAAVQTLAARAWLRGSVLPTAAGVEQWIALLSDEEEAKSGPAVRTQPWQDALNAGKDKHGDIRTALRQMINLPLRDSGGLVADGSVAADALFELRTSLSFSPGVSPEVAKVLPFDWNWIATVADRTAQTLPKVLRGETDMLQQRCDRLLPLLRGKTPRDHAARLEEIISKVSTQLIGKATEEIREWNTSRQRLGASLEPDANNRLVDLLWRFSPDHGQPIEDGAEGLAWLITAPASDLVNALELFRAGEAAVVELRKHAHDIVTDAAKGVNIGDIQAAGRVLANAAEAARQQIEKARV